MIDIEFYQKYNTTSKNAFSRSNMEEIKKNTDYMMSELFTSTYDLKMGTNTYTDKCRINFSDEEVECVFKFKVFKEPTINANGIELWIKPNTIKSGDYITMKHNYRQDMDDRVYIVSTTPQPKRGYDSAILYLCNHKFNVIDENGDIKTIYASVSDTKLMLKDSSVGSVSGLGVSSIWLTVQANKNTRRLASTIKRVLIDGFAKNIIDKSTLMATANIYTIAVENGQPHEKDDLINGIAYNENEEGLLPPPTIPTTPQLQIIGDDELVMDWEYEYTIDNDMSLDAIWSVNNTNVKIIKSDNTSCTLLCEYQSGMNSKMIELSVVINGNKYIKNIRVVNG